MAYLYLVRKREEREMVVWMAVLGVALMVGSSVMQGRLVLKLAKAK